MIKFYFKPRIRKAPVRAKWYITKRKKHALTFKVTCVFLAFTILFILVDIAIRPQVKENSSFVVKNEITLMVNECINEYLEREKITYNDLVTITQKKSGEISSISADTVNINKVKTNISNDISEMLQNSKGEKIRVPAGNLFNSFLLNNTGLRLSIKLTGYGYVKTDIISEFKSGGINQTLHRVFVDVNVSVNTNIGTLRTNETVETTVLLVETVLVGNVPDMHFKD
ncbi:MAG: sporulation protein YunB [Clostridia bacterium]|nr:sporulation protein YunB [Clostridia bacterium]